MNIFPLVVRITPTSPYSSQPGGPISNHKSDGDNLHVKWQIDFNINKCSTVYIGIHNTGNRYTQDGVDTGKSNSEKKT